MSQNSLNNDIFPEDSGLRENLVKRSKCFNILGWVISGLAVVFLIIFWKNFNLWLTAVMFFILIVGQSVRYYSKYLKTRSRSQVSALSVRQLKKFKGNQEEEVKIYFDSHQNFASKVLQMDKLAKKGQHKDAINIINNLMKRQPPNAIIQFLKNRRMQYQERI